MRFQALLEDNILSNLSMAALAICWVVLPKVMVMKGIVKSQVKRDLCTILAARFNDGLGTMLDLGPSVINSVQLAFSDHLQQELL